MNYLFWKTLHLVFMVSWFAAIFYLPRLFVYHAMAQEEGDRQSAARLTVMEKKLYRLGHGAMGATLFCGGMLLYRGGWQLFGHAPWLHLKLVLVALLVVYFLYCGHLQRVFAAGNNRHRHIFFRFFNEIPVLLLVTIVYLATFKRL